MTQFSKFLGLHPRFDLAVESFISHHLFGGFWFATCLFVFWVTGARSGEQKIRLRVLTILCGSFIAIALTIFLGELCSWLPPSRNPALAHLYPAYLLPDINDNSFPSQSTALYAAIAAGIYSLQKLAGCALWAAVGLFVSLPRVFVGGHYPSDVLTGFLVGLAGYWLAKTFLEPRLDPLNRLFELTTWPRILAEFVVSVYILQIAVEFNEFVWIRNSVKYFLK